MALAALSPLPYCKTALLVAPFAPLVPRRVLSEQQQNGCIDQLASFDYPSKASLPRAQLVLSMRPRHSSALLQNGLKRMQDKAGARLAQQRSRTSRAPPSSMSVSALAQSVLKAREQRPIQVMLSSQRTRLARLEERNSPKSKNATIGRSSSFGRVTLSPVRSAPVRTRSCAA